MLYEKINNAVDFYTFDVCVLKLYVKTEQEQKYLWIDLAIYATQKKNLNSQ